MKLSSPLRLVFAVLVVTAGAALLWWLVGFQIGKGMLTGNDLVAFKKAYGFEEGAVLRLGFFALAAAITAAAATGKQWLPLAGLAFGATLLFPDRGIGTTIGMVLFVICAAGFAEMENGMREIVVMVVAAILVSAAFLLEGSLGRSELAVVAILRGIFWFLPLFLLPDYAERYVLKKLGV